MGIRTRDLASRRRPFAIAIYDPNWFLHVLDYLKRRGLSFLVYESVDKTPYFSVLYTDYSFFVKEFSSREDVVVVHDPSHDCKLLEKAILKTRFKESYDCVTVGVDPGRRATYVLLGDDELIDYGKVEPNLLPTVINDRLSCIPCKELIVRVGGGVDGWRIALALKDTLKASVEVVDEEETSGLSHLESLLIRKKFLPPRGVRLDKDLCAAIRIALRKGLIV